jgi:predicted acyl esterase
MRSGEVYDVTIPPLVTSNVFQTGHRIQIAITSSSFPQLERNLNTGGNNFDEKDPVIAHNTVHHGPQHPSKIEMLVVSPNNAPSPTPHAP